MKTSRHTKKTNWLHLGGPVRKGKGQKKKGIFVELGVRYCTVRFFGRCPLYGTVQKKPYRTVQLVRLGLFGSYV